MKRIGIYGGSFDPVHNGHLHLANVAMQQFSLDAVHFVPAYVSPFKQETGSVADGVHRLAMLRLALEEQPAMQVSDYELAQGTVSYTIYTLRYFRTCFPAAQLVLLMGSDMLLHFEKWHCWQQILSLASLGCLAREASDVAALHAQAENLSRFGSVQIATAEILPLSSTKIRQLLKKGADCSCYLPKKVVQYIGTHHLYV
jgi:nicotinate-nucleotide adenylyltransferase